jgi:hypothetical protein
MLAEETHVTDPFAQGRHHDGYHVQTVEQVRAEEPGVHPPRQILMGGGQDPHVDLDRARAAHGLVFPFLQDAQYLGLRGEAHVPDLVQKEGAAVGGAEASLAFRDGTGVGALDRPEEFRLDQVAGNGGAVDPDERLSDPGAEVVQGARHQLLAGATFPEDQDPGVGRGDAVDRLAQGVHGGALAQQLLHLSSALTRQLPLHPCGRDGVAREEQNPVARERFVHEIERSQAGGLDRPLGRGVAADHDHRHVRVFRAEAPQDLHPVQFRKLVKLGAETDPGIKAFEVTLRAAQDGMRAAVQAHHDALDTRAHCRSVARAEVIRWLGAYRRSRRDLDWTGRPWDRRRRPEDGLLSDQVQRLRRCRGL